MNVCIKLLLNNVFSIKRVRETFVLIVFFIVSSCENEKNAPEAGVFLKYYGAAGIDELNIAEPTSTGEYILLGSSEKSNEVSVGKQMSVLKTDAFGIRIKENVFGGINPTEGKALKETQEGDFILLGDYENTNQNSDLYIVLVDKNLNKKWETIVNLPETDEKGYAIAILPDGNYFILGTTSSSSGIKEMITVVINKDGSYSTPIKPGFGQSQENIGKSIILRPNGRLAWCWTDFTDMVHNDPGTSDIGLVFTDEDGFSDAGEFSFGRKRNDFAVDIQKSSTGYILVGTSEPISGEGSKIYLVKATENGGEQWAKTIDKKPGGIDLGGNQQASSIYPTNDGGYIVLGTTDISLYPNQEGQNIYLVKTNSVGDIEWEEVYGGMGMDEPATVRQTSDGGFIIAATVELNGDRTMCLIKTNSRGKLVD